MDDNQLIYATPDHMASTLREIKALGVDRVKVTVVWSLIAPDASSHKKPNFNATNPAAYPYGAWTRWDQLVAWCRLLGLKVYFQIGPPAPLWATSGPKEKQRKGYDWSENPSAKEFGQFVQALGRPTAAATCRARRPHWRRRPNSASRNTRGSLRRRPTRTLRSSASTTGESGMNPTSPRG